MKKILLLLLITMACNKEEAESFLKTLPDESGNHSIFNKWYNSENKLRVSFSSEIDQFLLQDTSDPENWIDLAECTLNINEYLKEFYIYHCETVPEFDYIEGQEFTFEVDGYSLNLCQDSECTIYRLQNFVNDFGEVIAYEN